VRRICVYAGSNNGSRPEYAHSAQQLASEMVARGIDVVYGGGDVGLMKVVADTAMAAGGKVIGIIPGSLMAREIGHPDVTELRVVDSMHERKAMMAELSDGFVALPGGFGTVEEIIEMATWAQLGLHRKPCGLLDVAGFYDALLAFFDRAASDGFLHPEHRQMLLVADDPQSLLDRFDRWKPPPVRKWLDEDDI
jgi:uncharacterized protein (TIGR00730 family)